MGFKGKYREVCDERHYYSSGHKTAAGEWKRVGVSVRHRWQVNWP